MRFSPFTVLPFAGRVGIDPKGRRVIRSPLVPTHGVSAVSAMWRAISPPTDPPHRKNDGRSSDRRCPHHTQSGASSFYWATLHPADFISIYLQSAPGRDLDGCKDSRYLVACRTVHHGRIAGRHRERTRLWDDPRTGEMTVLYPCTILPGC